MGRKTAIASSSSTSGSKRAKTTFTSTSWSGAPSNSAQAARGNHPPPHCELRFSNSEHIARYDSIATKRIIESKYMNIAFFNPVRLWDSLRELIKVAGWAGFLSFTFPIYERLCWEF